MSSSLKYSKFSIVIPVRNESDTIERCINGILINDYPREHMEVIVVDGGSTDNTRSIVKKLMVGDERVKLLDNPARITPVGVNLGIRHSTGDLIVFMSGHAVMSRNFMAELARVIKEHPDVWRAGGVMETVSDTHMGRVIAAAQSSPVGVGPGNWRVGVREGYVHQVCFAVVPRFVFDRVGLYDEELVRNQDDEFNQRVREAGGKHYMNPAVRIQYFARGSLRHLARQYYQYGFWRIRTIQKRGRPAHMRQILPVFFVLGWIVLALGGLFSSLLWLALVAYASLYAGGLIANIIWVSRHHALSVALLTPLACAAMHFSYGFGVLHGFWSFVVLKGRFVPKPEAHKLSR
jgi:glycosyltransferase involved in cell wall biosynthesis